MKSKSETRKKQLPPFSIHHLPPLMTGEESRSFDQLAQDETGIQGFTLMEVAGSHAALWIRSLLFGNSDAQETTGKASKLTEEPRHLCFICGKGNNAGDALVAARYLLRDPRITISICLAFGEKDFTQNTAKNLELLRAFDSASPQIIWLKDLTAFTEFPDHDPDRPRIPVPDMFIDALLGSGLKGKVKDPMASVIDQVNLLRARHELDTVALDIASGLDATTGRIHGTSIEADETLSFGGFKQGFYLNEGPGVSGSVISVDLPFPFHLRPPSTFLFGPEFRELIPHIQRRSATHKYDGGVVNIIAGSPGLAGAAIMSARAAWGKGAGAVFLLCPAGILSTMEDLAPEIIKKPIGSRSDTHFTPKHLPELLDHLSSRPGSILVGPGLGEEVHGNQFVPELLAALTHRFSASDNHNAGFLPPVILDADALRGWTLDDLGKWIAGAEQASGSSTIALSRIRKGGDVSNPILPPFPLVLTPHPGEAVSLLGLAHSFDSDEDRMMVVRSAAAINGVWICSKGMPTLLASPDGQLAVSSYETAPFNRAGFGDVLSGQIAANLAFLSGSKASDTFIRSIDLPHGSRNGHSKRKMEDSKSTPLNVEHAVLDALVYGAERVENLEKSAPDKPIAPEDIL